MNLFGQDLAQQQWKHRVLIVKSSDVTSGTYQDQLREFQNAQKALIERKLVLYQIHGGTYSFVNFKHPYMNHKGKISKKIAEDILRENELFEVLLIGLDGTIKLRQTEFLTQKALYGIIDAMPMRKRELKH